MRAAHALWLLGLSIACSGCALVEDASRNMCVAISTPIEVHREKARNRRWAEAAWQEVCLRGEGHSEDFALGFKEGFAEYLFRGGNGEPPLVAPLHYRSARYQTPEGYQAIQDWFEGYRFGASAAQSSGARQWITGPSSLRTDPQFEGAPPVPVTLGKPPAQLSRPVRQAEFRGPVQGEAEATRAELMPALVPAEDQPDAVRVRITQIGVTPAAGPSGDPLPDAVRVRLRAIVVPPTDPTRVRIKAIAPAVE